MSDTAHQQLEMKDAAGKVHQIEFRQYTLNPNQQFAVLALDREKLPIEIESVPGIMYQFIGKLEEQNTIFSMQIENSLSIEHWDFETHPNPEILLITKL